MRIRLNGRQEERPPGITVGELLRELGLDRDGVAVAVNMAVVPRSARAGTTLQEGDRVEVIQAVGGG